MTLSRTHCGISNTGRQFRYSVVTSMMLGWLGLSCDSNDGSERGDLSSVSASSREEFLSSYAELICAYAQSCPETGLGSDFRPVCGAELALAVQSSLIWNLTSVDYDPSEGQRCLEALAAETCESIVDFAGNVDEPCWWVFTGAAQVGDSCSIDEECARGSYCQVFDECPGTCQALPTLREPCPDWACAPGLDCVDGVCSHRSPRGDTCNGDDFACADGLACESYAGGSDTCQPSAEVYGVRAEGETCIGTAHCKASLYCNSFGDVPICREQQQEGEECGTSAVPANACAPGTHCSIASATEAGICVVDGALGSPCDPFNECGVGACVDGTCQSQIPLGEPCSADETCYSGYCESGACAVEPPCYGWE